LLETELHFGRVRGKTAEGYQDRILDLDLLLFADLIIYSSALIVPHPRLHERLFVLAPLAEIEPHVLHPVLKRSLHELLTDLSSRNNQPALERINWPEPNS